jgi:hypothetical protein
LEIVDFVDRSYGDIKGLRQLLAEGPFLFACGESVRLAQIPRENLSEIAQASGRC